MQTLHYSVPILAVVGGTRHWYPYHFINVDDLGYGRSLLNMAGIFVFLLAVGWLYVFLDRRLRPRPG